MSQDVTPKAHTGLFYCPIAPAVHPAVDAVAARSFAWLERTGVCATERQKKRAVASNGAEFYGRICPEGAEDRLQIAADWIYWAGFFDDTRCDEGPEGDRAHELTLTMGRLLRMLESLDARPCQGDPCLLALHDLALRFASCATPVQYVRWVEAQRTWLFGVAVRRGMAARRTPPGLDAYLAMRLADAAGAPITSMIEIVNGPEVPGEEMCGPRVRALSELASMIGALDNDRISRFKEMHADASDHTLIRVIMHERGVGAEGALAELVALRDRMMCRFLALRERAAAGASPALARYLDDLGHMVRGHIDWSFKTARYSTLHGPGGAPEGSVSLEGGWSLSPSDLPCDPTALPSIAWWWSPALMP
jgi:terpene synthase-like protein